MAASVMVMIPYRGAWAQLSYVITSSLDTRIKPTAITLKCNLRQFITLRAKLSGTVYCYRSCLCVCNGRAACVCGCVFVFVGLLPR